MPDKPELTAEDKYQLLLHISQKVRDTLDLEEILNHLLDTVATILDYDAAGIFVLNQDLVHRPHERPVEVIAGVLRRGYDQRPPGGDPMLREGKGIVGHVIRTGESLVLADVRDDPRYVVGRSRTLSEIAVPIVRGERAIGALNLESDALRAYTDADAEVLRVFADAAAIAIEKAMLHRRLLERQRIAEQLHTAREVQALLLPGQSPAVPGYDIAGLCIPAFDIGGDYFDYFPLPDGQLGVVIADVSGNGIPAALVMSGFRALLRTHALENADPSAVALAMNEHLPEFIGRADFVTFVYGVLHPTGGRFSYSNGGHNPPLLVRAGKAATRLERHGPALGLFPDFEYGAGDVELEPGDVLLFYTDGVIEMADAQGDLFGVERLADAVQGAGRGEAPQSATALLDDVVRATRAFAAADGYVDDFTLVVIRRLEEDRP